MTDFKHGNYVPIDIGSRLQLMVDDYLVARLSGGAQRRLNEPVPQEATPTPGRNPLGRVHLRLAIQSRASCA